MKHEQSAPAGYRPRFAGTMKLYLVRHKEYGELTVNGVNKYEAVHAAARAWGVRWTAIARECEYIVLAEDTPEERRKRRRQRRRMQAALLASLLFALVLIVTLRIRETAPEPVAERTSALAAERQTLTYIAPARPEAAEETPEELTVEPEPENRYAELHFSDEDVYILACLVYHEARGESFEGQVAVVEVVLNRMLSDYFPDTVEEVVFQKYGDVWQFSPAPYLYSAEPDKEQYLAVHTAIEEREHILSEDTVYCSTAPYNESVDMIIGNHYFCKIF